MKRPTKPKTVAPRTVKRADSVRHQIGRAGASTSLNRARRLMNPSSAGPQVKRFAPGKGGGVQRRDRRGRFT